MCPPSMATRTLAKSSSLPPRGQEQPQAVPKSSSSSKSRRKRGGGRSPHVFTSFRFLAPLVAEATTHTPYWLHLATRRTTPSLRFPLPLPARPTSRRCVSPPSWRVPSPTLIRTRTRTIWQASLGPMSSQATSPSASAREASWWRRSSPRKPTLARTASCPTLTSTTRERWGRRFK